MLNIEKINADNLLSQRVFDVIEREFDYVLVAPSFLARKISEWIYEEAQKPCSGSAIELKAKIASDIAVQEICNYLQDCLAWADVNEMLRRGNVSRIAIVHENEEIKVYPEN